MRIYDNLIISSHGFMAYGLRQGTSGWVSFRYDEGYLSVKSGTITFMSSSGVLRVSFPEFTEEEKGAFSMAWLSFDGQRVVQAASGVSNSQQAQKIGVLISRNS